MRNSKTKIIVAVLASVVVILLGVLAYVFVSGAMNEGDSYTVSIEKAEKYLAQRDYEQAILAYKEAIDLDPKQEDAYLGIAQAYLMQGNREDAISFLRKGYNMTTSASIFAKLQELEGITGSAVQEEKEIDLATASPNIAWDVSITQKLVNYTFDDYKDEFGSVVSANNGDDGYLEVRHAKFNGIFYYKNTGENKKIVDKSHNLPYSTGMPEKVKLDSIGILFRNFDGGASLARMQMLFGEKVAVKTLEGHYYIESKESDIIAHIGTDESGNVVSNDAWNEILLPLANKKKATEETVKGVVVDAVTGKGIDGASMSFNPTSGSGDTVGTLTDSYGEFSVQLKPGSYEIEITKDGYIKEEFNFTVEKGKTYSGVQFVLSPALSGEARIVLEWGSKPTDLDSHLTGTSSKGNGVHVYFLDTVCEAAELDLDDTDGYGPETTTIHDLDGDYTFAVQDYTFSGTMAQNGATVKVYLPGQEPVTITLGADSGVDNVWEVCRINHGKLEIINGPLSNSSEL